MAWHLFFFTDPLQKNDPLCYELYQEGVGESGCSRAFCAEG